MKPNAKHRCEISAETQSLVRKGTAGFLKNLPPWKAEKQKYFKCNKLGEGSYGVVWLLQRQSRQSECIAMKSQFLANAVEHGMAENEVANMAQLHHSNVMRHLGAFSEPCNELQRMVILFPLMLTSLLHLMNCGNMGSQAQGFTVQALRGLHHCHEHHILHRDLKPSNMLLQFEDGKGQAAQISNASMFFFSA